MSVFEEEPVAVTPNNNGSRQDRGSEFDLNFSVFAWFLAIAVLFQLARGDMGLFSALRNTPNAVTFGDGLVPQVWFCCALVVLAYPQRVWSLMLLGIAGAFDFWWRLPTVTPSIYFHGLISVQVLLTALYLLVRRRKFRIPPAEFIDTFRTSVLGLLIVLFSFAVFHKFTWRSPSWTAGFFHLITRYYLPFLPIQRVPNFALWLLTVGGELVITAMLLFQRTRWVALLLCAGFACFVGSTVYGFGAIVLASLTPLLATCLIFEPFDRLALADFLRRRATAKMWRFGFAVAIGAVFLLDHATGFTLADRPWLFRPDARPDTVDVLTPMQFVWFIFSTTVFVGVLVAAYRHRSAIAARFCPARSWVVYALPTFFVLSEAGLYTGLKDTPNVAMFSGLIVKSCMPNHRIAGSRFLSSFFHRDLLFVTTPQGERIGIPALSLQAKWDRSRRLGISDPLIEIYRNAKVTRMRRGAEEPFDIKDLDNVQVSSWIEVILPRRLFSLNQASEADLRCSMPDLFLAPPEAVNEPAAGELTAGRSR